jgi:DUF177 domain-containing protein
MPLLSISAHDIDAAGLALDAALPIAWLEAELTGSDVTATEPGRIAARLSRSGDDVVVRGRVKAKLAMPCARCLAPARFDVDAEVSLLLRPHPAAPPPPASAKAKAKAKTAKTGKAKPAAHGKEPEYEFSAGEADVDTYDGEAVVLDPFVREAILLEAPNFPLCSEACPGIGAAPAPAALRPGVDPRLAPLGALREKLAGRGESQPAASPRKKKE